MVVVLFNAGCFYLFQLYVPEKHKRYGLLKKRFKDAPLQAVPM
jgi:hypothetical protein